MSKSEVKEAELEFVVRLVPWARFLHEQTKLKAFYIKRTKHIGLYPSIAIATILMKSEFGTHVLSQDSFRSRPSNNLALLEVDNVWEGDKTKFLNVSYKMFPCYRDFFVHWSDLLVFRSPLIELNSHHDQINLFSEIGYNEKIHSLIDQFNLREFDYGVDAEVTDRAGNKRPI